MGTNILEHRREDMVMGTINRLQKQGSQTRTVQQNRQEGIATNQIHGYATCLLPYTATAASIIKVGFGSGRVLSFDYRPFVIDGAGNVQDASKFSVRVWSCSNNNTDGNEILTSDLPIYISEDDAELIFEFNKLPGGTYGGTTNYLLYCLFDAYII